MPLIATSPSCDRVQVWLVLSGALERWEAQPGLYEELLGRAAEGGCYAGAEIEKDLHRTFPTHSAFDEGGEGRQKLRDVLTCYALRNQVAG